MHNVNQTIKSKLSSTWSASQLGEIAKVSSGGTPDRKNKSYWNGTIPWITTSLINFNSITEAEEFISEEGLRNSAAKYFPIGTVLMAMYGQGKTRGKVAILGITATTNQACAAIMPNEKIVLSEYLFYNLSSRYAELRNIGHGGNQVNLNGDLIKQIVVEYPTLLEQKGIVKVIATWDTVIRTLTYLISSKQQLKKGLMRQLLTGKKRLPGFKGEWKEFEFGKIFEFIKTESFSREDITSEEDSSDVLYIHYGDVHALYHGDHLDLKVENRIPGLSKTIEIKDGFEYLKNGDLIIADASEDYEGVGECIEIINIGKRKVIGGLHTIVARDSKGETALGYRAFILKNPEVALMLKKYAVGISVYGISKGNLSKLKLKLPPLQEQKAIASVLILIENEIQMLDRQLEMYKEQKRGLIQQLFTGKKRVKL